MQGSVDYFAKVAKTSRSTWPSVACSTATTTTWKVWQGVLGKGSRDDD
jgi:hypothetical protein